MARRGPEISRKGIRTNTGTINPQGARTHAFCLIILYNFLEKYAVIKFEKLKH